MNKQNSSTAELSSHHPSDEEKENGQSWEGKVDWKPLNDLVEAANRSKSSRLSSQGSIAVKSEPSYTLKVDKYVSKSKGKDLLHRSKIEDDSHEVDDATESLNPKKLIRKRRKKDGSLGNSGVTTTQAVVVAGGNNAGREKRTYPIWFQLVPFEEQ